MEARAVGARDVSGYRPYRFHGNPGCAADFSSNPMRQGVDIDLNQITYYMGRITLVPSPKKSMHRWRRFLFTFMQRNAINRSTYFSIPPAKVLEIGIQMEF